MSLSDKRMMWFAVLLSCVLVGALPVTANQQDESQGIREFTESGTWRVPAGVTRIILDMWGAGGGGGGGVSAAVGGGGGGGGSGAYLRIILDVKPRETYTVRIGAGGGGGRGEGRQAAQPGGDGEDTTILRDGEVLI